MLHDFPSSTKQQAHMVGICGAGMKALAEVLMDHGWRISGSDQSPDPKNLDQLKKLGVEVKTGHDPGHIPENVDLLIYSPAIPEANCERRAARSQGILQWSYVDALRELNQDDECVAIAGTHGKSSTSALLAHILVETGREPTLFCGAQNVGTNRNGRGGAGRISVVEACEYRQHFHNLPATHACLLSVEPDHFDCYPTFQETIAAYVQFVEQLPENGRLIANADCPGVMEVMRQSPNRKPITFSLKDCRADWSATGVQIDPDGMNFEVLHSRERYPVRLTQQGLHMVANALAAMAMACELGVNPVEVCTALSTFPGLKRRFEKFVTASGIQVIDDYAHHPTEIATTLSTAREVFPDRVLICVFQPHQVSRTESLMEEFAQSFHVADHVYVLPVFGARENCVEKFEPTSRNLVERISHYGTSASYIAALDRVWPTLDTVAATTPSHVVLTLGAGDITRINNEFH